MAQPTQERLVAQLEKPEQTSGNVGHAGSGVGPENSPHTQDHEDDHVHHVAMSTYYGIFALLIFLLLITVGAWYIDQHVYSLGHFSTPIAMAIAVAKAVAIVLFFMHVKFSSKLVQIFACTGVAFVTVMFVLTFQDYATRDWLPRAGMYSQQPTESATVNNDQSSGLIIRSSSVGAGYNSQSTPSDNMASMARNVSPLKATAGLGAPASIRVMGADVRVIPDTTGVSTRGATNMTGALKAQNSVLSQGGSPQSGNAPTQGAEQSGASGASGMASGRQDVATNGSASNPGPIIGGAANNSFGSAAQSGGIEPKPASSAPAAKAPAPQAPKAKAPAGAHVPPPAPVTTVR